MLWLRILTSELHILTKARFTHVKHAHSFTHGLMGGIEKLEVLGPQVCGYAWGML